MFSLPQGTMLPDLLFFGGSELQLGNLQPSIQL